MEFNSTSCDGCESSNEIVKTLQGALEEKDTQISKLQAELESLQLKESENVSGSRIHLNLELKDSNCYNCESKEHNSVSCPNPPYLRYFKSFILRKNNFCLTFKLKLVELIICLRSDLQKLRSMTNGRPSKNFRLFRNYLLIWRTQAVWSHTSPKS